MIVRQYISTQRPTDQCRAGFTKYVDDLAFVSLLFHVLLFGDGLFVGVPGCKILLGLYKR